MTQPAPSLQEQLAAQGIQMPPMGGPPPPPDAPAVLNMPPQTIGPQGPPRPPQQPLIQQVRALPPSTGESLRPGPGPNANPLGQGLDLGLLHKTASSGGPDINVDLSKMPGGGGAPGRVGYVPQPQAAAGPSLPAFNPYAHQMKALEGARKGNEQVREMQVSDNQFQGEQEAKNIADASAREQGLLNRSKEQSADLAAAEKRYLARNDELANDKLDSNRLWHNKSTGSKILSVLSIALGGFAQGWNHGGPNVGLEALNTEIARDIEDQKAHHEDLKAGAAGEGKVYQMMMDRFQNERAAIPAAHAYYTDRVLAEGRQRAALSKNVDVQSEWQKYDNALSEQSAALQDKAAAAIHGAGIPKVDWKAQHEISKDEEGNRSVAGQQAVRNLQQMMTEHGGELPGSGIGGRILGGVAQHGGLLGGLANMVRGADARQAEGAKYQVAEASLPPSVRGSPEAIGNQKTALFGAGSPEEVTQGLARAQSLIDAQTINARAGFDPKQVSLHDQLLNYQGAAQPVPQKATPPPPSFKGVR